jgi:hypothetical protein
MACFFLLNYSIGDQEGGLRVNVHVDVCQQEVVLNYKLKRCEFAYEIILTFIEKIDVLEFDILNEFDILSICKKKFDYLSLLFVLLHC